MKLLCWLFGHKFGSKNLSFDFSSKGLLSSKLTAKKCSRCGEVVIDCDLGFGDVDKYHQLIIKDCSSNHDLGDCNELSPSKMRAVNSAFDDSSSTTNEDAEHEKAKPTSKKIQKSSSSNTK